MALAMPELVAFIREALTKGQSREQIRQALLDAGWEADEVEDGLSRFAESDFPIPVPRPRHSGSPREAFLYLVTFIALYTSALSLGALQFGILDHFMPDPVENYYYSYGDELAGMRWNIATLLVAYPLFALLTRTHLKSYKTDPERRASSVRRWLTYLTLVVAACVIIGTLIGLIGGLLGGVLALKVLLKILIAMLLSGAIFLFYLWEVRLGNKAVAK